MRSREKKTNVTPVKTQVGNVELATRTTTIARTRSPRVVVVEAAATSVVSAAVVSVRQGDAIEEQTMA